MPGCINIPQVILSGKGENLLPYKPFLNYPDRGFFRHKNNIKKAPIGRFRLCFVGDTFLMHRLLVEGAISLAVLAFT